MAHFEEVRSLQLADVTNTLKIFETFGGHANELTRRIIPTMCESFVTSRKHVSQCVGNVNEEHF